MKKQSAYVFEYQKAVEFAKKQNEHFWLADEISVEKDKQDFLVNLTTAEKHGVLTTLKLFTHYELFAGQEYWGKHVTKMFPKPCINMMANCFSYFEINVHAPFYNKLNEVLGVNTPEFYNSYVENPVLKARMDELEEKLTYYSGQRHEESLLSLAFFSMLEGAVLYSSFAFLKHFQSKGKNKLVNVVRGINFSVRDENLHSLGGAYLYNTLKKEYISSTSFETKDVKRRERKDVPRYKNINKLEKKIKEGAITLYEHEEKIIDLIYEEGPIEGLNNEDLKTFVKSRIDFCLNNLGIDGVYNVGENPIADWFYNGINAYSFNDFFTGMGNEYTRKWSEDSFQWGQLAR